MKGKDIEAKRLIYEHELLPLYKRAWHKSYFGENDLKEDFLDCFGSDIWRVANNIESSRRNKARRCRQKVGRFVTEGKAYFVTLTFKDEVLDKTSEKTRRRYVSRFLKAISDKYVANIDYGDKKHREHYHAIIRPYWWTFDTYKCGKKIYTDAPNLMEWNKKYGYFKIDKIGSSQDDMKKVAKYTAKLSAHALKKSTLQGKSTPRLITSRWKFIIKSLPMI